MGAENWATFVGLIETCKLGGINHQACRTDVLTHIVLHRDVDPIDDLHTFNWGDRRLAARADIEQTA